jgi:endosialidase-like protein
MPRFRLVAALLLAAALTAVPSCGTDPTPPPRWYFTCGDPVCSGYQPRPGVPACTSQTPGAACAPQGDTCDPVDGCNRLLVCATSDPTQGTGGCPISRARFKRDIEYLSEAEVERLYAELRRFRLATYRYRAAPPADRARLGFIIEDVEPSAAVDADRDSVDLYGYASMAVAALQVQAKEIESLRTEVEALRHRLDARAIRSER